VFCEFCSKVIEFADSFINSDFFLYLVPDAGKRDKEFSQSSKRYLTILGLSYGLPRRPEIF